MRLQRIYREFFNLHKGEADRTVILENVKSSITFTGSNLWILMGAIMVASVGLNVNSTAVIIGAMLISPLMGPIIGSGFALAIYDFELLKKSLKNLLIATIASLFVSTVYFFLSPFKEAQSELLARTSPNIYDVLIAFFGGLVGVIAITRIEKGNPIPGVAIATALMPPLCTAGYGLATGNFKYFFGAFFLYTINCVFIGIATFVIIKYLKYPALKQIDPKQQKQIRIGISIITMVVLIPSFYFAFSLYKSQRFTQLANDFVSKEFENQGDIVVHKRFSYFTTPRQIELAFLLRKYNKDDVERLNRKLIAFGLENTQLVLLQNDSDNMLNFKNTVLEEIGRDKSTISEKDKRILELENLLAGKYFPTNQILAEIKVFFPTINSLAISNSELSSDDSIKSVVLVYYNSSKKISVDELKSVNNWLKARLKIDQVVLATTQE